MHYRTNIKIIEIKGGAILYDKINRKSYIINNKEFEVFKFINDTDFDGNLDKLPIIDDIEEEEMLEIINNLVKYNLVESFALSVDYKNKNAKPLTYSNSLFSLFSIKCFQILWNIIFLFVVVSFAFLFVYSVNNIIDITYFNINYWLILYFVISFMIANVFHVLNHIIASKINGAYIGEFGVKRVIIFPVFYINLCGLKAIKSKFKVFQIYFSGIIANLFVAEIALILIKFINLKYFSFLFILVCVNLAYVLGNLLNIKNFDGYRVSQFLSNDNDIEEI